MYPHTREKNSCTRLLSTPRVMSERLSQVHAVLQLSRDGASWKLTIEDQLKQWICWMIRSQLIVFMHYMYCTPGSPVVDAAVIRLLQDRSSNGTWVNGTSGASRWNLISLHLVLHSLHFQQTSFLSTFVPSSSLRSILGPGVRLKAKEQMALKTCDQICFVPPGNGVEQLVYEARSITIVLKMPSGCYESESQPLSRFCVEKTRFCRPTCCKEQLVAQQKSWTLSLFVARSLVHGGDGLAEEEFSWVFLT